MDNTELLLTDEKTREIARKWFVPELEEVARDYGYHIQGAVLSKARPLIEKQERERIFKWVEDHSVFKGHEAGTMEMKIMKWWWQALKGER